MLNHGMILCRVVLLLSLFTTIHVVVADHTNTLHIRHAVTDRSIPEGVSWLEWLNHHFYAAIDHSDSSTKLRHSPTPSTYNETEAIYLAYLTSVAYCQARHIQNWSCSPCVLVQALENITVVEDTKDNFQGLVGYSRQNHAIIIAFRGSMDIPNWIDNLTFFKTAPYTQFPTVHVHEGFYWVYESVSSKVIAAIRTLRTLHPNAHVTVTGHSLGGAVAALCAFHLAMIENIPVYQLYTFGEPRVGDSSFSTLIQKGIPHTYRVTHYHDVVPHVPQTWLGFKHSVQEVYYDEYASTYQLCDPNNGEDPLCSDVCSPFGCRSVVDHLTYVNVTMSHLIC